jgi:alkanesulfonate monooxygenase SsuD/methylene tetrahydromethanopterin reductase-like flavin-dependent oxidoreductase (luciferase family)
MRFGLWYHLRNPARWAQSPPALYAETLDQIARAESLGFDSVWTSEHHFTEDGYLPSSLLFLAAAAARTRRVRLGTLILLLPLHHPLRVAEDAAVVDIISNGRLDLGVAAGYRVEEFDAFGVPHAERGRRVDEALAILRAAGLDAPCSAPGPAYRFANVDVTPKPVQRPLPIYMGGQAKPAIRRAAKYGCHLMPGLGASYDLLGYYHDALREFGHDPAHFRIKHFQPMWCCEDVARGWDEIKAHWQYQHNLYRRWYREAGDSTAPDIEDPDALPRATYFVGTPDQCEAHIRDVQRQLPIDEFIFWASPPGVTVEASDRSVELFAREVAPRFRTEAGA